MKNIFSIICVYFVFIPCLSQELIVIDCKEVIEDISAREQKVNDANGDGCGILKIRCGIAELRFSCDLGIQKIEKKEGEFWLWVSPGTRTLTMESAEYKKIEFSLPKAMEEFSVFVVSVSASLPEKTIIKSSRVLSFSSKPINAHVYINNTYSGRTPFKISIPDSIIQYKIGKKKYSAIIVDDTLTEFENFYFNKLTKDPKTNRLFINCNIGFTNDNAGSFANFRIGWIGKFGAYLAYSMPLHGEMYDEISKPETGYNYLKKDPRILRGRYSRIGFGFTSRFDDLLFFNFGIGYSKQEIYSEFNKIPVSVSNPVPSEYETVYHLEEGFKTNGAYLELGTFFRIKNQFLFSMNCAPNLYLSQGDLEFICFDFSFGLGYCF